MGAGKSKGGGVIASRLAAATEELVQDPARHQKLIQEQNKPDGLVISGVSLKFMKLYADECGVQDDMTAADVCGNFVKPMTVSAGVSAAALLKHDAHGGETAEWVGPPTHFLSYAWSYSFRRLIGIVERFEEDLPPEQTNFYFFDQFSLNQHKFVEDTVRGGHDSRPTDEAHGEPPASSRKDSSQTDMQLEIVAALKAQMLCSGHVVMCLWPLEQPTPLQRAWCLFELWVALSNNIKVTMVYGDEDVTALYQLVSSGTFHVNKIMGEISAQNAGCMVPRDKELILGYIESEMGADKFNAQMREHLLQCMKECVTSVFCKVLCIDPSDPSVEEMLAIGFKDT